MPSSTSQRTDGKHVNANGDPQDAAASTQGHARRTHVIADRASRDLKARKIIAIVGLERFRSCRRALEVGCGSGIIAHALARFGNGKLAVDATDVVDSRIERDGYDFHLVTGTALPFDDAAFDLVITNHVSEHVGGDAEQLKHLAEIRRVTAATGVAYFAAPNKWRLVEAHYRLPFLSWLPPGIANAYLRAARHVAGYDCHPQSRSRLERMFEASALDYEDRTIAAMRQLLALEHPDHPITRIVNAACPDWLLRLGLPIVPTHVFLLRPASSAH